MYTVLAIVNFTEQVQGLHTFLSASMSDLNVLHGHMKFLLQRQENLLKVSSSESFERLYFQHTLQMEVLKGC